MDETGKLFFENDDKTNENYKNQYDFNDCDTRFIFVKVHQCIREYHLLSNIRNERIKKKLRNAGNIRIVRTMTSWSNIGKMSLEEACSP